MLVNAYYQLPKELQRGKNESELWVEVGNNSRIELKGADNEDSLRGSGLDGMVIDEVASINHFKVLWEEVLRPALTDKKGWCMFIGTPKGYNHFYELWMKGQPGPQYDNDWISWQFTSYDNPYLDPKEIDKAKKELTVDAFAQEYLAEFKKHTGLIYKEFDRKIHVIEPKELPSYWQFYRSMDFGAVNPTACLWIAVDTQDNIYIFDEYYERGRTSKFNAETIVAKTKHQILSTFGDPSAEQSQLDYAQYGIFVASAVKFYTDNQDWVKSGIDKVSQYIKLDSITQRPRLYVFNTCVNTIKEFETYAWQEQSTTVNSKEVPVKENDHLMDALRYFIGSYQSPLHRDSQVHVPHSSITGY